MCAVNACAHLAVGRLLRDEGSRHVDNMQHIVDGLRAAADAERHVAQVEVWMGGKGRSMRGRQARRGLQHAPLLFIPTAQIFPFAESAKCSAARSIMSSKDYSQ